MKIMKQSVLLGLRDKLEKTQENMNSDMLSKFKNKQTLFKGERRTYHALEGFADEPTKRGFVNVASTIDDQLEWYKLHSKDYFDTVLTIEKTNAQNVTAELVVDGKSWGNYTTLELLRLKSIMDGKMKGLIGEIPIRDEKIVWKKTEDSVYEGRSGIFEGSQDKGFSKTTIKEMMIAHDPHIKEAPNRAPVPFPKDTQVNIGEYSSQQFSGEYTTKQRADLLVKYDKLYTAIIVALETANNVDSTPSDLGGKVLEFLIP